MWIPYVGNGAQPESKSKIPEDARSTVPHHKDKERDN